MNKICLCMIERNEAHVLPRSLGSFRALAGDGCDLSYGIVDGGSTDGSVDLIRSFMDGVPGQTAVFPQPDPLDDFARERNRAIEVARPLGDYLWMLDADDEIQTAPGFVMPRLTADAYKILVKCGTDEFPRLALVKSSLPWRYVGRMHENLDCPEPHKVKPLDGIWILVHPGAGARSVDPRRKFLNDAAVLRQCLEEEPGNLRHLFYLAQSLRDAGELEESLRVYRERAAHTEGWDEETYFAMLQVARILSWLNRPFLEVQDAFLAAHFFRPTRAESLGLLAEYCRKERQFNAGRMYASLAMKIKRPKDGLFVTAAWYEWRAADECAISSYWAGDYRTCRDICIALLSNASLPAAQQERVRTNLAFAETSLR
jgi:glycosyltransferase involved in cell wall biosynthesis